MLQEAQTTKGTPTCLQKIINHGFIIVKVVTMY